MNRNAEALLGQVDAYAHLSDRVSVGGRFDGLSSDGPIRLETDEELVAGTETLARADPAGAGGADETCR